MNIEEEKRLEDLRCELMRDTEVIDEFEIERIERIVAEIEKIEGYENDFDTDAAFKKFSQELLPKAIQQMEALVAFKDKADKLLKE